MSPCPAAVRLAVSCAVILWGAESLAQTYEAGAGHLSVDVLNLLFSHPVDEDHKVRERMGRGYTVGDSHTEGDVTVRLVPNSTRAECVFHLQGSLGIDNAFSVHGSVHVRSRVRTRVSASKTVFFDQTGMTTEGAVANCRTNLGIVDISADRRFVERIGTRRAHRTLGEMEQLVSSKTARQFEERLDERMGAALDDSNARLGAMMQLDDDESFSLPDGFSFKSSAGHLEMWATSESPPQPSKEIRLEPHLDVQSIFHESVANAVVEKYLAGRRLTDEAILDLVQKTRGSAPPVLWVHDRRPRWSMTLAEKRPIDFRFLDGEIHATVHLSAVQHGDDTLEAPLDVILAVRPEFAAGGFRLRRILKPVVMIDPSSHNLPDAEVAKLADMLEAKFQGIFPEEAYFDGMAMPRGGSWDKVRQLKFVKLYPEKGWFEMSMKFAEPDQAVEPGPEMAL